MYIDETDLTEIGTPRLRQVPITAFPPANGYEIENRYRCIDARHEGRTYNSWVDGTFCLCGRVVWPGNTAVPVTRYERAEADADRTDTVGTAARNYLNTIHSKVPA